MLFRVLHGALLPVVVQMECSVLLNTNTLLCCLAMLLMQFVLRRNRVRLSPQKKSAANQLRRALFSLGVLQVPQLRHR